MASRNANSPPPQSQEEAEVASFLAESSLSATYDDDDDVQGGHDEEAPEIMAARQLVQLSGDSGERSSAEEEGEEVRPRAAAMKTRPPCGRRKRKYLPIAVVYAKTRPMPAIGKRGR